MARFDVIVYLKLIIICTSLSSLVDTISLPNQQVSKPRQIPTLISPTSTDETKGGDNDLVVLRLINRKTQITCILLKTDAVVEVNFKLHDLNEQAESYIPAKALVEGSCTNEDQADLRIHWTGYSLTIIFAKTPGGERWYIKNVELTASTLADKFHGIETKGKSIKLYHRGMLIPTPVGKSYSCNEVDIPLETDENDHPPPSVNGTLLLRLLQVQPFMYKGEEFGPAFECKGQKTYRDETAPIAVGSTLAVAALMTVTGYGIFRYFKVKNVQYNTME